MFIGHRRTVLGLIREHAFDICAKALASSNQALFDKNFDENAFGNTAGCVAIDAPAKTNVTATTTIAAPTVVTVIQSVPTIVAVPVPEPPKRGSFVKVIRG